MKWDNNHITWKLSLTRVFDLNLAQNSCETMFSHAKTWNKDNLALGIREREMRDRDEYAISWTNATIPLYIDIDDRERERWMQYFLKIFNIIIQKSDAENRHHYINCYIWGRQVKNMYHRNLVLCDK